MWAMYSDHLHSDDPIKMQTFRLLKVNNILGFLQNSTVKIHVDCRG